MKIENSGAAGTVGFQSVGDAGPQRKITGSAPAGTDQVNLGGGLSALLNGVTGGNGSGGGDRVAQLRSLYASGNYRPNPLDVSRSLVSSLIAGV